MNFSAPFEDVPIGASFTSRGRTVTEADVVAFASVTGDWHPQHSDAEWAARSAFGERIAHGMLVVSFAVGLVPFDPERVLALRRISDAVFKRPVRLGDTIHVEGSVADRRRIGDEAGLITWSWSVINQEGRLVCRAKVDVLWAAEEPVPPQPEIDTRFVPIPL
jgi:3-hydroxybutyryl-CoA dehydratase